MGASNAKVAAALVVGFAGGLWAANVSPAVASPESAGPDMEKREFHVFIDEIKQNFAFGEQFSGRYKRTVTMSDGSTRTIELKPMVHKSMQVVELKDGSRHSYMGLNGTTTNGKLMVQLVDVREMNRQLKEQGWPTPAKQ